MKKLFTLYLVLTSTLLFSQPGSGHNLEFNGTSNFIECGTINLSLPQVTLQGWVRAQSFKTSFPFISSFIGTEQSGSQCAIRLGDAGLDADKAQFILRIAGVPQKLNGATALTTNKWYHIAGTYDGSTMKLYINGELDTSMSVTGTISSNALFEIGRNYDNSRIIDGEIDEVSVFGTALTESEIRDWMCKSITSNHPEHSNLIGYWPLNEGNGSTTADQSGNSYNGSLISSPTWGLSSAPIGNESVHTYTSGVINMGLASGTGDSMAINVTGGNHSGLHIYRVDTAPNQINPPSGYQVIDTMKYWGVFPIGSANYSVSYYYNSNLLSNGAMCYLSFAKRPHNADTTWDGQLADTIDYANQIMTLNTNGRKEIIFAISNNGPHQFSLTELEPFCYGDNNGQAFASVNGGLPPFNFNWSTGSTADSSGSVAAGWYYVTVTDANSCQSQDSIFIDQPDTIAISSNISNTLCKDTNTGAISLSISGGTPPFNYNWSNGTTSASTNELFAEVYSVTITDNNGCSKTASYSISSTGPEPFPFLGNDTTFCDGIVYGLTAATIGGPYTSYNWSNGNTSQINVINASGQYSITVENSAGCSGSDTIDIAFVAAEEVDLGPNNQSGIGEVALDAGSGFLLYQWNTGASAQTITVTETGEYWVKTTDTNGCQDADTANVTITPTGIEDLETSALLIYPNPVEQFINIHMGGHSVSEINIADITGKVLYNEAGSSRKIDLSTLPKGLYFITIITVDGERFSKKIMKE